MCVWAACQRCAGDVPNVPVISCSVPVLLEIKGPGMLCQRLSAGVLSVLFFVCFMHYSKCLRAPYDDSKEIRVDRVKHTLRKRTCSTSYYTPSFRAREVKVVHWSDVVCYAPSSSFGTRKALYVIVLCANSVPAMF